MLDKGTMSNKIPNRNHILIFLLCKVLCYYIVDLQKLSCILKLYTLWPWLLYFSTFQLLVITVILSASMNFDYFRFPTYVRSCGIYTSVSSIISVFSLTKTEYPLIFFYKGMSLELKRILIQHDLMLKIFHLQRVFF